MAASTTIKIAPDVRDRLNERAAARGVTAGVLVEELLDRYERGQWFDSIHAAYQVRVADDYDEETREWESLTVADGLDDA